MTRRLESIAGVLARLTDGGKTLSLGLIIGDEDARLIAAALPQCAALQNLHLQNNHIGDEGARLIAAALPQCTALQHLFLYNNSIGYEGARLIAAALPNCAALQTLDLSRNSIGDEGARLIAAALPNCAALQTLNLSQNSIGAEGARLIAAALPQCAALQALRLDSNDIGDEGARVLADALPQCAALQTLRLACNSIGDEGARFIVSALPQCVALQTLRLNLNRIDEELIQQIGAELAKNRQPKLVQPAPERAAPAAAPAPESQEDAEARARADAAAKVRADSLAACAVDVQRQWAGTLLNLGDCTVCPRPITAGTSILLPSCLHAVCTACAAHQRSTQRPVECGICRIPSTPTLVAHPIVESDLAAGQEHACTKCAGLDEDERLPAAFQCGDCNGLLCETHATNHRLVPKFKTHTLAPLPSSSAVQRCATHDLPYTVYCDSEACKTVICTHCLASTHPAATHRTRLLDASFVDEARARLTTSVDAANRAMAALVHHAAAARLACKDVAERDAALRTEVATTFRVLHALLERREEAIQAELVRLSEVERAALTAAGEGDLVHWCAIASTVDVSQRLGPSATPVLAQLEPTATARLHTLVAAAPTDAADPVAARVQFDAEAAATTIETAIASLGRFVTEKTE